MSRTGSFGRAAAVALWCMTPSLATAASLNATGNAAASAHTDSAQGQGTLTPGPDSLMVVAGATANDTVINSSPPPERWEMVALFDAVGTARYGALAGTAHAEASSLPSNNAFLAGGIVTLILGYTDAAEVASDTLAAGTPVTLTFFMTLDAAATHFTNVPVFNPNKTGASVRHEVEVRDLDDIAQPSGQDALVINSAGTNETSAMFEFETEVGHELEIVADLFVSAGVSVDYELSGFSQGSADVVTGQPAGLYYQAPAGVRLDSDSGHNYVVPELGRVALQLSSASLLLSLHWKRRRKPPRVQ